MNGTGPHLRGALPWMIAVPFLAFQMAWVVTGIRRGPGSSTEGLAYPFTLIYAGGVWLLVYLAVRLGSSRMTAGVHPKTIAWPLLAGVLLIATAVSGVLGHRKALADVRDVVPVVLFDDGRIESSPVPATGTDSVPTRLVAVGLTRSDTLTLGGQLLHFVKDTNALLVSDATGTPRLSIALPALSLPLQVEVVSVSGTDTTAEVIALLITGSSRSKQAMLAIVDTNWSLVYSERMYRRWPIMRRMLELRRDPVTHREVLVVAPGRPAARGFRIALQ